jgi:archaellum component FlaC
MNRNKSDSGADVRFSLDAGVFLSFALAGVGAMAMMKWLALAQSTVTAVVVLLVIAYAVTVLAVKRLRLRLDQAGDNAYYLGLVFTLCSMGFALIEIGKRIGGEAQSDISAAEAVIGDFGLALASTLFGILCRIMLHQMRQDPGDVEATARLELAESATRMRFILDGVTSEFGQFLLMLRQKQENHASELATAHEQMRRQVSEGLQQALTESKSALDGSTQRISESLTAFAVATENGAHALVGATERLNAVEPPPVQLFKRYSTMAEKAQGVVEQFEQTSEQLAQVLGRITEASDIIQRVAIGSRDIAPRVAAELDAHHRRFDERARAIDAQVAGVVSTVTGLQDEIRSLKDEALTSFNAVKASEVAAVQVLDDLKRVVEQIDDKLQQPS